MASTDSGEPLAPRYNDLGARIGRGAVTRSTLVLIALRVGYAYNWFSVGPALPAIGATFGVGPEDWGILVASFLVGAGLFQVPAGLLSRRYGPRVVSLWGVGLLAGGGIASAFSPTFAVLVALRLASGIGAGLFFSPAIGLVGSLYPPSRSRARARPYRRGRAPPRG